MYKWNTFKVYFAKMGYYPKKLTIGKVHRKSMSFIRDVVVQYKSLFLDDIHSKDHGKLECPRDSRCISGAHYSKSVFRKDGLLP